jgi:hypothetical protein
MGTEDERTRAWVLVLADDPETVAEQILEFDEGEDELVVIRADTVDGGMINLVAAIDAASNHYEEARSSLMSIAGIQNAWFLVVSSHQPGSPSAPHDASGYITEEEYDAGEKKEGVSPGRQDNSPGFNPWG